MKNCLNCGKELFDEAVICPNCKCSVEQKYTVTITRQKQVYLYNPAFKITIDGTIQDEIPDGASKSYTLSAGQHRIFFKGSFRTKEVVFVLREDVTFLCGWNRATGQIDVFQQS